MKLSKKDLQRYNVALLESEGIPVFSTPENDGIIEKAATSIWERRYLNELERLERGELFSVPAAPYPYHAA